MISLSIRNRVVASLSRAHPDPYDARPSLTLRESQVLQLIADGLTNRQIGERLSLAEKTVKNYVSGLLAKLGMERRTQAAVYGSRLAADLA
jgi:DNA-binding NarL/FixJ family response regulator